ncbi:MAG: hypothetical protein AB7S72_12755 [Draconibacterium sp.]|jgi:hypothetical protein
MKFDENKNNLPEQEEKLSASKRKIWGNIKEGLNEVGLIEQGKIKGKSSNKFLSGI